MTNPKRKDKAKPTAADRRLAARLGKHIDNDNSFYLGDGRRTLLLSAARVERERKGRKL